MFQTHLNYFSSLLPIKFVGFFKKKEKSQSSALADVHTSTQIQVRREMLLYLTHKGGSIRKAYPKSRIFALAEKRAL